MSDPVRGGHPETVEVEEAATVAPSLDRPRFAVKPREPRKDPRVPEAQYEFPCASCDGKAFPPFDPKPGQRVYCEICLPQVLGARDLRMALVMLGGGFAPCEVCGEEVKVFWRARCPQCLLTKKVLFKGGSIPTFSCNTKFRRPKRHAEDEEAELRAAGYYGNDDEDDENEKLCESELEWRRPNFNRPVSCPGACFSVAKDPLAAPEHDIPEKPQRSHVVEALSLFRGLRIDRETVEEIIRRAGGMCKVAGMYLPAGAQKALAELQATA